VKYRNTDNYGDEREYAFSAVVGLMNMNGVNVLNSSEVPTLIYTKI